MTPAALAQLIRDYGASGVAALCILAMVYQSRKLDAAQDRLSAELNAAREREVAALRTVLPVTEKLLTAVAVLEAKNRRRSGDGVSGSTPGTPNPLLVKP